MGKRTAQSAAVLDRGITQQTGGPADDAAVLLDQVVEEQVAVAGHGAYGEVIAPVAHVAQVFQAAKVDEDRGRGQPEAHDRDEGVPAGQQLRVLAVLAE